MSRDHFEAQTPLNAFCYNQVARKISFLQKYDANHIDIGSFAGVFIYVTSSQSNNIAYSYMLV